MVPDSAVKSTEVELVKVDRAEAVDVSPDVVWILAVGSDARPGEDMTHTRGDALQLIGMNTKTGAATAIGIPRDSWVPIPGHGTNKINAALYFGGPQLLGQTVGNLVGIQPDYVFVSRFKFFEDMIGDIGGIDVNNPVAFDDDYIKPKGFQTGRIHLGGYDALAFSRIRHNLIRGDFDRSANQQRVLRGIQSKVRAKADQPGFIERGVFSVIQHMHTDLSPVELYRLGQAVAQVDPDRQDHQLRRPGQHRQHRRRQRGPAVRRPGPPLRRRRRDVDDQRVLATLALVVPYSAVKPPDIDSGQAPPCRRRDAATDVVWILAVGSDTRPART